MKEYAVIFLGAWRAAKNLTQEELARRTNLEVSFVEGLEQSNRDYSPEIIAMLAKGLGIEPFRLFVHPAVQFDERHTFEGVKSDTVATMLSIFIPDLVAKLGQENLMTKLAEHALPEEYWSVQADKLLELLDFLKSCREDQPAALRSLFEALETDSPLPHNPD